MYSVFNKLNDSIINSSYPSKDKGLHIIFCSKFKNLLDDYISNYFTKYLFYFLFIFFWVFEIIHFVNFNLCLMVNDLFMTKKLYIVIFKEIVPYITHELPVISSLYDFFEFNFNFIRYIAFISTGGNFFLISLFVIFLMIGLLFIEFYTHLKQVSILTLVYCYLFFSFLVFSIFKLELLSFEYASILMVFIPFLLISSSTFKKMELLDLYIVGLMVLLSLVHPIFIILFLFSLLFLCRGFVLKVYRHEMNTTISLSEFRYLLKELAIDFFLVSYCVRSIYPYINVNHEIFFITLFIFFIFIIEYTYSFFIRKK
jgi:hypothetical protein